MEKEQKQLTSIFGKWWETVRKWFYPTWLLYELSIRFYDYAIGVYNCFIVHQHFFASYIGDIGTHTLAIFCSVATFIIFTAFLTAPACFVLYKFFTTENLTNTQIEKIVKINF